MNAKLPVPASPPKKKQGGLKFWQVLVLIVIAVSLSMCAQKPEFKRALQSLKNQVSISMPSFNTGSPFNLEHTQTPTTSRANSSTETDIRVNTRSSTMRSLTYDEQFPVNLARGYYTVQVMSSYNSRDAYDLRKDLGREGYNVYIHQKPTETGILFRVRIGEYKNRTDAFAIKEQIRRRYPARLGDSFVVLVNG